MVTGARRFVPREALDEIEVRDCTEAPERALFRLGFVDERGFGDEVDSCVEEALVVAV